METDDEKHPDPLQIERVVRGEASRAENRALVRHLLHGCPQCQKMARKSLPGAHRMARGAASSRLAETDS